MTRGDLIRSMDNEGMAVSFGLNVKCDECMFKSECGLPPKGAYISTRGAECAAFVLGWLNTHILKPCPFCGGEEPELQHIGDMYVIKCKLCNARIECESEEFAVKHWNRREDDDEDEWD